MKYYTSPLSFYAHTILGNFDINSSSYRTTLYLLHKFLAALSFSLQTCTRAQYVRATILYKSLKFILFLFLSLVINTKVVLSLVLLLYLVLYYIPNALGTAAALTIAGAVVTTCISICAKIGLILVFIFIISLVMQSRA